MNILITGGHGFIAYNLHLLLKEDHIVFNPGHEELDILNFEKLRGFIDKNNIDIVIHTAMVGGIRTRVDGPEVCYQNVLMMENLIACTQKCKLVINLGSGAEFDRRFDIVGMPECAIYNRVPIDYYGLSKNIIAKRIVNIPNIINLRIFNCFGKLEKPSKFISNVIANKPLVIHQDHYMDFFYIKDLYSLITFYIDNYASFYIPTNLKDVNCVYNKKYKLTEIADMLHKPYTIIKDGLNKSYTGCGQKIQILNLPMIGLEEGLKEFYNAK